LNTEAAAGTADKPFAETDKNSLRQVDILVVAAYLDTVALVLKRLVALVGLEKMHNLEKILKPKFSIKTK